MTMNTEMDRSNNIDGDGEGANPNPSSPPAANPDDATEDYFKMVQQRKTIEASLNTSSSDAAAQEYVSSSYKEAAAAILASDDDSSSDADADAEEMPTTSSTAISSSVPPPPPPQAARPLSPTGTPRVKTKASPEFLKRPTSPPLSPRSSDLSPRSASTSGRVLLSSQSEYNKRKSVQKEKRKSVQKEVSAPSIASVPRWRFVNEAKKTSGYSSTAAGQEVKGKSAEEVIGSYKLPKYTAIQREKTVEHVKDQASIVEKGWTTTKSNEEEKPKQEVGKIIFTNTGDDIVEEVFEGTFGGFHNKQEHDGDEVEAEEELGEPSSEHDELETRDEEVLDEPTLVLDAMIAMEAELIMNELKQQVEDREEENNDEELEEIAEKVVQEQVPSLPVPPTRVDLDGEELIGAEAEPKVEVETETKPVLEVETASAAARPADDDELDKLEKQEEGQNLVNVDLDDTGAHTESPRSQQRAGPLDDTKFPPEVEEEKKRKWKLLLLALLILAAVIGALLGSFLGGSEEDEDAKKSIGQPDITSGNTTTTNAPFIPDIVSPTIAPSAAPTAACEESTEKLFSVSSKQNGQVEFLSSFGWVVKDVCTGEEVIKCLPCASVVEDDGTVTTSSTLSMSDEPTTDEGVRHRFLESNDDRVKQCVPDRKYMFEIESPSSGECCGFDPTNFVVYYDGKVVRKSDWLLKMKLNPMIQSITQQSGRQADNDATVNEDLSQAFTVETQTYFGAEDDDGPCPSASPSTMPSIHPTITGTYPPTPSPIPPIRDFALPEGGDPISSLPCQEVMDSEMHGRIVGLNCGFCGFCQWKQSTFNCYQRMAFLKRQYGTGELEGRQALCDRGQCSPPDQDAPEYEYIWSEVDKYKRCEQPGEDIETALSAVTEKGAAVTVQPTKSPIMTTTAPISSQPTKSPTVSTDAPNSTQPTKSPTMSTASPTTTTRPTESPTSKPTCDSEYGAFNLCIAVDMSGSVCNQNTDALCTNCETELICNDIGVDKGTCCNNFLDVIEFSKLMVNRLASIPTAQAYTIVGYGSNATIATDMSSSADTLAALDALSYAGGRTNHAAAINACQSTMARNPTVGDGRNLILLITDGDPSEPGWPNQNAPAIAAEFAATQAKQEGSFIIPVKISHQLSVIPPTTEYLEGISSDGSVFDTSDFSMLNNLGGLMVGQVLCQV